MQRKMLRKKTHDTQLDHDWINFRETSNELERRIKTTKRTFKY